MSKRFSSLIILGLSSISSLQADIISLNFIRSSDGATTLTPTDSAGVVPAENWNNATIDNANMATGVALVDESATATSATADWQSGSASWSVPTAGVGSPGDMAMMTGYLDQGTDGAGQIHRITINNIPYANYDVYLYHSSNGGPNRTARYSANEANIFTRNLDPANVFDGFTRAGYATLAEAALAGGNPAGNYVRWEGLSTSTLSIEGEGIGDAEGGSGGNTRRAPIQGIQIVEIIPGLPVVENLAATLVDVESATVNGNLKSNGTGADSATVTIYWGTTDGGSDPLLWDSSTSAGSFTEPDLFSSAFTGLSSNTTYYYRNFANNSIGDDWAPFSESFTTLPAPALPEVETRPASEIELNSATAQGELLNNGEGADPSELTIYWGTSDGGTDPMAWESNSSSGSLAAPGTFSLALTGLTEGTEYYYRAFAENSVGPDWAPTTESFITLRPSAKTISMNFVRVSNGAGEMARSDIAGVRPVANWNTATIANANSATGFPLIDDGGADSGATIDWQTGGASWSVATAGAGSVGDMLMMTGYLDQGGDGNGQIHTITINDIPYTNYDVYLYHSSSGGANRTARYQANGIDIWTRNLDPANTFDGFIRAGYPTLDEAALAGGSPAGNYVLWEGLSGATLNIQGQGYGDAEGGSGGTTRRAPIQGVQIVAASPDRPLAITSIIYDQETDSVTLTWNSEPGVDYSILASDSMQAEGTPGGWVEIADFAATEIETSYEHILPDPAPSKQFYIVRRIGN